MSVQNKELHLSQGGNSGVVPGAPDLLVPKKIVSERIQVQGANRTELPATGIVATRKLGF